jgi:glucose-1-phosphate cytidylyltransferase
MEAGQLMAFPYDGFWMAMDTAKDRQRFDDLRAAGDPPWEIWKSRPSRRTV